MAHPATRSPPRTGRTKSTLPKGFPVRRARWWFRVPLSTRMAVPQAASVCQGGMQVTMRHTMGRRQVTPWLHCPYRNPVQPDLRLLHDRLAQPHRVPEHHPEQMPPAPQPHDPQRLLQSTW